LRNIEAIGFASQTLLEGKTAIGGVLGDQKAYE
jgi:hypothetical protein